MQLKKLKYEHFSELPFLLIPQNNCHFCVAMNTESGQKREITLMMSCHSSTYALGKKSPLFWNLPGSSTFPPWNVPFWGVKFLQNWQDFSICLTFWANLNFLHWFDPVKRFVGQGVQYIDCKKCSLFIALWDWPWHRIMHCGIDVGLGYLWKG